MSGKLDQSLDEILSTRPRGGAAGRGRRGGRRAPQAARNATVAPVGGVKKNSKTASTAKSVPTGPSGPTGEGKITISNLPRDVSEAQIKEYFTDTIGPIKRAEIQYGPNGVSRGKATVIFSRVESATKAIKKLNGIEVDGRPILIEMIVDAQHASAIPAPKGLSDRISQPKGQAKPQPKSAAATKATANGAKGTEARGRGKGPKARGGRAPRPAKKTAEELDSEMADYFDNGNAAAPEAAAATNGAAPATNGDAMEEEVL